MNKKRQIVVTLAVLLVIVVIVAGVTVAGKKKPASSNSMGMTSEQMANMSNNTASSSSATAATASFKDGTYTASGTYESPGGEQSIGVTVTLKGGVVTDTSAQSGANDPTASGYQQQFIGGYKSFVVGKKITDVSLSRVSGSSLTSEGFNSAIQSIESQAKA